MECFFINLRINIHSPGFLIIGCKMLQAGSNALLLDSFDKLRSKFPCQIGILTVIFKIPPSKGASPDIYRRRQHSIHAFLPGFQSHMLSQCKDQISVPGGSKGAWRRITGARFCVINILVKVFLKPSNSCRTVRQKKSSERGMYLLYICRFPNDLR